MVSEYVLVESLVRSMSKWCPGAGFDVRALIEVIEGNPVNLTTVLKFLPSPGAKGFKELAVENTNMKVLKGFIEVNDGFNILAATQRDGAFELGGTNILLEEGAAKSYIWHPIEQIWRRNGVWTYGTDRPATLARYSVGQQVPSVRGVGALMRRYSSMNELIWFELVSEGSYRPANLSTSYFHQRGIHMLVPHWHAHIDKIDVQDYETLVELKSDIGKKVWGEIFISHTLTYDDDTVSRGQISAVRDDGTCKLPSNKANIRSADITLLFIPEGQSEQYWVDFESGKKRVSATNSSLKVHKFFDSKLELLSEKLLEPGDDSVGFEWSVAVLLHMAGYQVEWWGYQWRKKKEMKNRHEIDILAIDSAAKMVLAVECTTSDGDLNKKVQSVGARAAQLEKETPGWQVLPMVCIPLKEKEALAAGFGAVFSGPVRILNGDGIRRILEHIESGYPHNRIAEELTGGLRWVV